MTGRFTVLASGSSGNAALLEVNGFGLLIDCGLHPRTLTARLREAGTSWEAIRAVVLTHTHGDHWKDSTLADLRSRKIPIYAHRDQLDELQHCAMAFDSLSGAKLARPYRQACPLELAPGLTVFPQAVSHDAEPTFAFRIDQHDSAGIAWSIGYASDLGCASPELVAAFAGVDVLAVEFNHDVQLERASRRPRFLVDRVLGDRGHLSNDQAAELTSSIAACSGDAFPTHLIQLHLSRECNRPQLAARAGQAAIEKYSPNAGLITARQDAAAKSIPLARHANSERRSAPRTRPVPPPPRRGSVQRALPGLSG